MRRITIFGLLIVASVVRTGNSAIVDHGSYTQDTNTTLEWIDLTLTQNYPNEYSFNDVVNMLGPGQQFDGWRIPTKFQVDALLGNAGIPVPTSSTFQNFDYASGNNFINLFGQTGLIGFDNERASAGIVRFNTGATPFYGVYEVQSGLLGGSTQQFSRVRLGGG